MKWKGRRASSHVEDRRGAASSGLIVGGIGTIILVLVIALMGGNPLEFLGSQLSQVDAPYTETAEGRELAEFASVVLAETEEVWTGLFRKEAGMEYQYPGLVLYTGYVQSGCGSADSSAGPFYCSADQKVYLDLSFYTELKQRFRAPGDFAMAYVIAHEIGHHVQHQLGILDGVMSQRDRLSEREYNKLMVALELQADYFAGVWAHYVERGDLLEEGDIEEALAAAGAVGDDRIQKETSGRVIPDSFTHGTSEQRACWFYRGFKMGTIKDGDTFSAPDL